jgi:hypothetical protein
VDERATAGSGQEKIVKLALMLRVIDSAFRKSWKGFASRQIILREAPAHALPQFRRRHLFVGSGAIEAGWKTVIGSRLKQSGMFWTVRGASAIVALRCCQLNGQFEDYWEGRRAA